MNTTIHTAPDKVPRLAEVISLAAVRRARTGPELPKAALGSSWYHDAAIKDERESPRPPSGRTVA